MKITQTQLLEKILKQVTEINKKIGEQPQGDTITITDDGKKSTSELLKDIGCKYWSCWDDKELDKEFPKNKSSRKFRFVQEADDHKDMSFDDIEKQGLADKCMTIRERLIFEKIYFEKTGNHLDIDNYTLCSGSRYSVGYVPFVRWLGDKVCVFLSRSSHAESVLRSRAVVS